MIYCSTCSVCNHCQSAQLIHGSGAEPAVLYRELYVRVLWTVTFSVLAHILLLEIFALLLWPCVQLVLSWKWWNNPCLEGRVFPKISHMLDFLFGSILFLVFAKPVLHGFIVTLYILVQGMLAPFIRVSLFLQSPEGYRTLVFGFLGLGLEQARRPLPPNFQWLKMHGEHCCQPSAHFPFDLASPSFVHHSPSLSHSFCRLHCNSSTAYRRWKNIK